VGNPLGITDVSSVAIGQIASRDVIVSGTYDGMMQVWDARTREKLGPLLSGHTGSVYAIAVGCVGERDVIVSGSEDNTVILREYMMHTLSDPIPRVVR
jgi:WD40 repeat protein